MSVATPSREDFAALLEESFAKNDLAEGYVPRVSSRASKRMSPLLTSA